MVSSKKPKLVDQWHCLTKPHVAPPLHTKILVHLENIHQKKQYLSPDSVNIWRTVIMGSFEYFLKKPSNGEQCLKYAM